MTDKEKLEKVRAEIERRKKEVEDNIFELGNFDSERIGLFDNKEIYNDLLSFIDSMQKEPKECMYSKDNYTDEDRKALCCGCEEECEFNKKEDSVNNGIDLGCGVIWKDEESVSEEQVKESLISKHDDKTCKENGNSLTQEPISDELEKVVEEIVDPTVLNAYGVKEIANRLRRTMIELVSEDLEKAAKEYSKIERSDDIGADYDLNTCVGFIAGANWQKKKDDHAIEIAHMAGEEEGKNIMKQQMMAKAVDATVHIDAGGYPYIPQMELYDYDKDIPLAKRGDKYKVILIKEG